MWNGWEDFEALVAGVLEWCLRGGGVGIARVTVGKHLSLCSIEVSVMIDKVYVEETGGVMK